MTCGFFPVSSTLLTVSGRDAERYLQARLTNDIKKLAPGQFCEAAALTPQGRTEAFCAVLKRSPQEFLLLCESDRHEDIHAAIKRFLVAERVDIIDASASSAVLHIACSDSSRFDALPMLSNLPPSAARAEFREGDGSLFLPRLRTPLAGWDIIVPRQRLIELTSSLLAAAIPELDADEQRLLRLRAGIPSFPEEMNPEHLFSESGLMHAVSFTKGCYTGQEVVAKIDALGKTPRLLRRLRIENLHLIPAATVVESGAGGQKLGTVLSAAMDPSEGCTWCFCDLKNVGDFSGIVPHIDGHSARFV